MKHVLVWLLNITFATRLCAADVSPAPQTQEDWAAKSAQLLAEWRKPEGKNDQELRKNLIEAAVFADQPEVIKEVAAGGGVEGMEIKLPADADKIEAKTVLNLGEMPDVPYRDGVMDCVIRRMTKRRFEAWTPKHGWLFNAKGQLIDEAVPPRRDGIGRQWHGAFLPDGSWVTTDLWDFDKTLSFFSRDGKWLKEIKAEELAPSKPGDEGEDLIGWARCDKQGEGWVVSIGSEGGRALVFVKPQGKAKLLEGKDEPWKLCYPRDLEPKGSFIALSRPSDDFKSDIRFESAAHGPWVGYPTYTWQNGAAVIADGTHNFGFLPGSHDVFIGTGWDNPEESKTWFFDAGGKCRDWVEASYLTDSADRKAIWLLDGKNRVATLGLDLKPGPRMRFVIGGAEAKPVKLFTDLRLGFFNIGRQLLLASW